MPILLTTASDPGDNDPGASYPRAQILSFGIDTRDKRISFVVGFGDVVDSKWQHGNGVRSKEFSIEGDDYDTMIEEVSLADEKVYDGAARVMYAWLQANHSRFAGTVE